MFRQLVIPLINFAFIFRLVLRINCITFLQPVWHLVVFLIWSQDNFVCPTQWHNLFIGKHVILVSFNFAADCLENAANFLVRSSRSLKYYTVELRSPIPVAVQSTAARLQGLLVRIPPVAWMSLVRVLYCQVEVSASGWFLVQRSHTKSGRVLECDQMQQ